MKLQLQCANKQDDIFRFVIRLPSETGYLTNFTFGILRHVSLACLTFLELLQSNSKLYKTVLNSMQAWICLTKESGMAAQGCRGQSRFHLRIDNPAQGMKENDPKGMSI